MGIIMDSSLGSATAAGDELRVPPAAIAAGDPACVVPIQDLSFAYVGHAHVFSSVCFDICFVPTS